MEDSLKELFPDFLQEAYDTLSRVQETLKRLPATHEKDSLLEDLFRGIHTVKGGCGMFELHQIKDIAHKLETALSGFRGKAIALAPDKIIKIQKTVDVIEDLLRKEDARFHGLSEQNSDKTASADYVPCSQDIDKGSQVTAVPSQRGESLPSKENPKGPTSGAAVEVLRVPLHHISNALNNIWEVFLIRNQLEYLFEKERPHLKSRIEFLQSWEALDSALKRNISELESTLMAMRMSSVKGLFTRMEKVVRSYLDSCSDKDIVFETNGESTELDKKVIDMLGEPLIHLIRNAMDHGIETMEARANAGKSPTGKILLSAEAMADRVLVRIQDDGKGIDGGKLIEKAKAKGLDVSSFIKGNASPVEIIFMPGFSTAEKLTDVSGRGVGMDAVRHSIAELGGSVEIETQVGKGSIFSINLPLSLSVIPATVFQINSDLYGSNIGSIVEICRVLPEEIKSSNGNLHYYFRGKYIPVYDLTAIISTTQVSDAGVPPAEISLFITKYKHELVAIMVSDIIENTEVVVKPLPELLPKYSFVQGMSILPTGKAIFILSFDALLDVIRSGGIRPLGQGLGGKEHAA